MSQIQLIAHEPSERLKEKLVLIGIYSDDGKFLGLRKCKRCSSTDWECYGEGETFWLFRCYNRGYKRCENIMIDKVTKRESLVTQK